jgi:hypothetical protein
MIIEKIKSRFALVTLTILAGLLTQAAGVQAAGTVPIKEIETSHFGWEVDKTTKGKICTVESKHECQQGQPSSEPGGFQYSESIAGASSNIYVLDRDNHRVQELEHDGKFVLMFGSKVNKKGGDLCTAAEEGECQAGVEGTAPGQFAQDPQSIAVDPTSGDLYVAETLSGGGRRVQEFTATGQFVLEIGREVNETKDKKVGDIGAEKDVCTEEEIIKSSVKCTVPAVGSSPEPGAFNFPGGLGNLLAVGGPEDLLYVGDEHRVQVFHAKTGSSDGQYKGEMSLTSISAAAGVAVSNLALDGTTGNVYVVYNDQRLVRELDPAGTEIKDIPTGYVLAIAVDSEGLLAVSENAGGAPRGSLYEVGATLHLVTQFASHGAHDMVFNSKDELYAAFGDETSLDPAKQEVIAYRPVAVGALFAAPALCAPGTVNGTDATFDCTLEGEVEPWGVSETVVWFDWGGTEALGEKIEPSIHVANTLGEGEEEPLVKVSASLDGLRPNATFYYGLAGEDHNVKAPESMTSTTVSHTTPPAAPRIVGEPIVAFVKPSSAVLFGSVNPENTLTEYEFQYAPLADCKELAGSCAGRLEASVLSSPTYGEVGVAQEVSGLQPAIAYRYRLFAKNAAGEALNQTGGPQLPEGTFQTGPPPAVVAQTGSASLIGSTSAVISGSVNPDGQSSTYVFEMGVYEGAGTHYGIVFSADAGAGSELVEEHLGLSGLQPGTTYAYRIAIHFGDGSLNGASATGATEKFKTEGLPAALVAPNSLSMLSVPPVAFPKEPGKLTRAQQLANALKACTKKPKNKRTACRRSARKKYAVSKTKGKKK